MLDVALVWNNTLGRADIAMAGPDLLLDRGLRTALIISLFTDRLADAGDTIPDGTTNRRGHWSDLPLLTAPDDEVPYLIGSRLWLLDRALQTLETLRRAESYAKEATAWMIIDGVAGSITAAASFPQPGWIKLAIDVYQAGSVQTFDFAWQNS